MTSCLGLNSGVRSGLDPDIFRLPPPPSLSPTPQPLASPPLLVLERAVPMAGAGCHSLLSPASPLSPALFSRHRAAAVGGAACRAGNKGERAFLSLYWKSGTCSLCSRMAGKSAGFGIASHPAISSLADTGQMMPSLLFIFIVLGPWRNVIALVLRSTLIPFSSWHACASVQSQIRCLAKDEDPKGCADMSKGKTVSVAF